MGRFTDNVSSSAGRSEPHVSLLQIRILHEPAQRVREPHLARRLARTRISSGLATTTATHRARDVATFSRLRL